MKKSIQHHSHCPRKTVTPNLHGNTVEAQILCDFCWDEYSFCWSELCIHEWYEIVLHDSKQVSNERRKNE